MAQHVRHGRVETRLSNEHMSDPLHPVRLLLAARGALVHYETNDLD